MGLDTTTRLVMTRRHPPYIAAAVSFMFSVAAGEIFPVVGIQLTVSIWTAFHLLLTTCIMQR
jgi:hypothetical protein